MKFALLVRQKIFKKLPQSIVFFYHRPRQKCMPKHASEVRKSAPSPPETTGAQGAVSSPMRIGSGHTFLHDLWLHGSHHCAAASVYDILSSFVILNRYQSLGVTSRKAAKRIPKVMCRLLYQKI
jgi:hypothetical protein